MKAEYFIDKIAKFQANRLMDIKSAKHLVRLVPGGRGNAVTSSWRHLANTIDVLLKLIKTIRFNSQITSTFCASISQMCMCIASHLIEEQCYSKNI